MIISAIVAMASNRVIGNRGDIPWKIPGEQKMFKERGANEETKRNMEDARKALELFYQTKAAQNEHFASLNTVDTLTMQKIIELIPDDLTLIEYYYNPNNLYIWVVDNKEHYFVKKIFKVQILKI